MRAAPRTAHEAAADWAWMEEPGVQGLRVQRGRVVWEEAQYLEQGSGRRVRLARLDEDPVEGVAMRVRYVDPDTPVEVVREPGKEPPQDGRG